MVTPRAEGEGQILPGPLVPAQEEEQEPLGPRLPDVDIRPGRPTLPESLEIKRIETINRANALDLEIQELAKPIPGAVERIRQAPSAGGFEPIPGVGAPSFEAQVGRFLSQEIFGRTPSQEVGFEAEEAFRIQIAQLNNKRAELYSVTWQSGVLNALPVWIEAGLVDTPDDVINLSRPGILTSREEKEFISSAIMDVKASRAQRSATAQAFAQELAEGTGSLSALLDINPASRSSQELVNDLVAAGRFQLPTGVSIEDAREMLLGIGFSETEVDAELFDVATEAFRMSQELLAWNTQAQMLLAEGEKIASGVIVSAIRREQWLRAASQPAIALMRPIEWWVDRVAKPGFVTLAQGLNAVREAGIPASEFLGGEGLQSAPPEVIQKLREFEASAASEGVGSWTAKRIAFDQWEAPWYTKLLAEIVGDPLTLLGFGVYTKITRPIPLLGAGVRHTEAAFVFMGEVPFRGLRAAWQTTIPKTLTQRGEGLGRHAIDLLRRTMSVEENFGKPFHQADPAKVRGFVEEAIEQAITNPQAMDNYTTLGQQLIIHQPWEPSDIRSLYPSLGLSEDITPITIELVSEFNRIFEKSTGYGATKVLDNEQAAQYIAQRVLGLSDDQSSRIIRNALDARVQAALTAAKNTVARGTLKDMVFAINDHVRNGFVNTQRASIRNTRYQQGLVAGMLDGLDLFARQIYMEKVDRFVTQKIARAYLVFGFYSVANIAEAATKSIFAGINPLFRRHRVYDTLSIRSHGLQGLPLNLVLPEGVGFDLSLAMPIDAMRTVVKNRRTGGNVLSRAARKVTDRYVMAYNDARLMRNIGNDLQTIFGYNLGTQVTNAQLGNYMNRVFYKVLAEAVPEHVEAAGRLIDNVTINFDSIMSKKVAEAYRESMFDYLITGDKALLDNFTKTFTPGRAHRGEVEQALDKYADLPTDIKDTIAANVESGVYWGNTDELRELFEERLFQHYFSSPEVFENSFRELFEGIFQEPVRNQAELNVKVEQIRNTLDVFDDMTHNTLASAVTYSRTLHSPERADRVFEAVWTERIIPSMERVTFQIEDAAKELRASLDTEVFRSLDQASKDRYNIIIDQMVRKAVVYQQARLEQNAVRTSFFRRNGRNFIASDQRSNANFWDAYFRETDAVWENARSIIHGQGGVNQQILGRALELDSIRLPPLENITTRALSRADVARMYGVHPGDLERSVYLTDIMAIQGRDNFIDAALNRAQLMGTQQGTDAATFGWTRETVGDVYDSIVFKMKTDPRVNNGVESLMLQLHGAMEDVQNIGFRRNAIMSDEKMQVVQAAVEDLQSRIRGKPLAPEMINQGVEFVPEVQAGRLALPSGEAQAARRNNLIREQLRTDREQLEAVQAVVVENIEAIRGMPRRDFNAASTRLGRLRDRGVDIRRADSALNTFGALRDAGQGAEARIARTEAWDDFLNTLGSLNLDVEATLDTRAVKLGEEFLLPGQRGAVEPEILAPTGSPVFIQNLINAGLEEELATRVAGRLQIIGAKGKQFTREALARELGPGLNVRGVGITSNLERLGIITRTEENLFRLSGETARSRITQSVIRQEQFPDGPVLEFQRKGLRTFQGANEPADWVLRDIYNPNGQWKEIRQQAFDETNARRQLDFPDYENQTALSYVMKAVYPFWGYEAHRWAWWLPREAVRHPGVWAGWGKYIDNTDQGYVSVPGTTLDVNPLRGTIFMGGFRRLQQRDYPEYYDSFKGVSEFFDYGSRWGFYPGFPIAMTMATWGAKSGGPQWGEVLPALARNALIDVPSAVAPEAWERVRQTIFPDRFRDFLIANEVSRLDFDKETGINGMELLRKKLLDQNFTPEEDAIWARAVRGVATWGLLMEQTGLFRLRPEEKTQVFKDVNEILSKETGVPIPALEDMRRFGLRFEDVFGALSPETKARLNTLERYQRFSGGSLALLPSELGQSQALVREFWEAVEEQNTAERETLLQVEQDFLARRRTFAQWERAFVDFIDSSGSIIENLKATDTFKDVPVTQEERLKTAEETGIKIFMHPLEELKTLYFEKALEDVYDEETGQIVPDFEGLFLYRDIITQSLPDNQAREFQAFRRRNDTPLTALRFGVTQKYFRPYKEIRDVVLASFNKEEQSLIREFLAKVRLLGEEPRASEIQQIPFAEGDTTLIAEYNNRVRTSRVNLRVVDPELDAWLNVFGETHSFLTQQARSRAEEITRQLQIGNLGGVLR